MITTGIELVDRELKRHEPFPNDEAATAMVARLLFAWRVLQPGMVDDTVAPSSRSQRHRRQKWATS
jgi:hypothetical protein